MKYVLLCGGLGTRCAGYSWPKPLNMVDGRHMVEAIVAAIPGDTLFVIYNVFLDRFHFRETLVHLFPHRTFHFAVVPYVTRGAVETAFVGVAEFLRRGLLADDDDDEENVLFLDNDNLHEFPADFVAGSADDRLRGAHFVGYGIDRVKTNFSFLDIEVRENGEERVVDVREKEKISDHYCCGFYGFRSARAFRDLARSAIERNQKTRNEFYFSRLYRGMLDDVPSTLIRPVYVARTAHIGSLSEIEQQQMQQQQQRRAPLRVCFDLDNTLVTYPEVPGDYATVRPIVRNIALLRDLKARGAEVVIHTARRMKTHGHNVGKVVRDVAAQTLATLAQLDIPYDELLFGKPFADLYVDDKALNPYLNAPSAFGFFSGETDFLPNQLPNNRHNRVTKRGDRVTKRGPHALLRGEVFFYRHTPAHLRDLFPAFHGVLVENGTGNETEFEIDHVNGIPLFHLYRQELLTATHIDALLAVLARLHAPFAAETNPVISESNLRNNYLSKLAARFDDARTDYALFGEAEARAAFARVCADLETHYAPRPVDCVHGDFWLSNILLCYDEGETFKLLDMKGQVDGVLTLRGDLYYDYGKLLQSLLGYDLVLNDDTHAQHDAVYAARLRDHFLARCAEPGRDLHLPFLHAVARALIFGNIPFIDSLAARRRVWAHFFSPTSSSSTSEK